MTDLEAWAVEWHSRNATDGESRHLIWSQIPGQMFCYRLFRTRIECRAWIEANFGYIRDRDDLQAEPFGWRMPQAVRVGVSRLAAER